MGLENKIKGLICISSSILIFSGCSFLFKVADGITDIMGGAVDGGGKILTPVYEETLPKKYKEHYLPNPDPLGKCKKWSIGRVYYSSGLFYGSYLECEANIRNYPHHPSQRPLASEGCVCLE